MLGLVTGYGFVDAQGSKGVVAVELWNGDTASRVAFGEFLEKRKGQFGGCPQLGLTGLATFPFDNIVATFTNLEKTSRGPQQAFPDLGVMAKTFE